MIIDCISDLHGFYPELEGGDLLIVAGDLTASNDPKHINQFKDWCIKESLKYRKTIIIAGTHDNWIQNRFLFTRIREFGNSRICYLEDSGAEVTYYPHLDPPNTNNVGIIYKRKTLKIWGSPWTKTFKGMSPTCKAFTVDTEEELAQKWALIPDDVDILVTRSPPYGILDKTQRGKCEGSKSLQMELFTRLRPKLFVCAHIHEAYGREPPGGFIEIAVNASHVNEVYQPVNKPIRIIL